MILDPTAGGGSIPFEALRLGHHVIANELNPVATVILYATLEYPARFGPQLAEDIAHWGNRLVAHVERAMADVTPFSSLPEPERQVLREHCKSCPEVIPQFDVVEHDHVAWLYCRQVACPHCGGKAPLLNSCWLAKEGEQWGVAIIPDPQTKNVRFETYRVKKGTGPKGEDPELATVADGVGTCIHCKQAIPEDEIKRQARGESEFGTWTDRLYCVAAVRYQPKLDKQGKAERYKSGERKGEIKTEKVTFFRPPNARDLEALAEAKCRLEAKWDEWDAAGVIPTEEIPPNSNYNRGHRLYGTMRWCDMFTPRQLLGHLTLVEELNRLKPQILAELGEESCRAVVTYLQFAIDKALDYNSNQTRWEYTRGIIKGTFSRHNFAIQWTFGEMIFTGPSSGAAWALSQVVDAYESLATLLLPLHQRQRGDIPLQILNNTAAHIGEVSGRSVDLICMDPPYYDNVLYGELSDFFYVWHWRTLRELYPMVASYGQALRVLSEQWPVLDGDEPVSPIRAMNEASRVVAERQIVRLTQERLQVNDLQPEAAMALTLYGIYGLHEMPYDEALNLSRSLNIRLDSRSAGYTVEGRMIGLNQDAGSQRRRTSQEAESTGYHAPLIRKGSKLRLARPEERHARRLEQPQTEWDVLHGLILAYRHDDIPVARAYLQQHANSRPQVILDLLHVWAAGTSDEALRKEGQTMVFGLK